MDTPVEPSEPCRLKRLAVRRTSDTNGLSRTMRARERDSDLGGSVNTRASGALPSPGLGISASIQGRATGVRTDSGSAQSSETL